MVRKYHNHILYTNPRHREEEPQDTHSRKTPGRQLKQSNQPFLPHQDGYKTRKNTKYCLTKKGTNTEPHTGRNNESTTAEPPP